MKAQEIDAHTLLSGTKVFTIPIFQRRYSWKLPQWSELWADVRAEYEAPSSDGHFLGSIVLFPEVDRGTTVSEYLVIDGQQRLTTLLIMIAALRDVRLECDLEWAASEMAEEYDFQYLRNKFSKAQPIRIRPSEFDREAFSATVFERDPTGTVGQAYGWFRSRIAELVGSAGFTFSRLADAILLRLTFVEIRTGESDSVNSIFNTLNSKGLPLSAADLIRNEYMWALGDEAPDAYARFWRPMEERLTIEAGATSPADDSPMLNYFWAQAVRRDPRATQRDLFASFLRTFNSTRAEVGGLGVRDSLERLSNEHPLYAVMTLDDDYDGLAAEIPIEMRRHISALFHWGSAPHIPVTLEVLSRVARSSQPASEGVVALDALVSFLIRRALVGLPSNNLNRMLSPIPAALADGELLSESLSRQLSRPDRHWPTDSQVREGVVVNPLFAGVKRAQSRFVLGALHAGDGLAGGSSRKVAHYVPATLDARWNEFLGGEESIDELSAVTHTVGNLVLIDGPLNRIPTDPEARFAWLGERGVGPLPLGRLYASQKDLACAIRERSVLLGESALRLWAAAPMPSSESASPADAERTRGQEILDVLLSMPDDAYTTDSQLAAFVGLGVEAVRRFVAAFGPESARLVREDDGSYPGWMPRALVEEIARHDRGRSEIFGSRARLMSADELLELMNWQVEGGEEADSSDG